MGTFINIGNAGFQSARNGEYVDKSGLGDDSMIGVQSVGMVKLIKGLARTKNCCGFIG